MIPVLGFWIILGELWFLSIALLVLHRLSPRIGLAPLLIMIGGLTAALQFRSLGLFQVEAPFFSLLTSQGSFLILPVLLLGMLVVYIVNGTFQARVTVTGIVTLTVLIALLRLLPAHEVMLGGLRVSAAPNVGHSPLTLLASAVILASDLLVLVVSYQGLSNMRGRFPSRMAAGLALLIAVWNDALLFPLLSAGLSSALLSGQLAVHLAGKSLAVLLISPILGIYLSQIAPNMPETAATTARPALDLFATRLQVEERARYHYSLLRTLSQVNQLIMRTNNVQVLLQQACQFLITGRNYSLAWIDLVKNDELAATPAAMAGPLVQSLETIRSQPDYMVHGWRPAQAALLTGQAVIVKDIAHDPRCTAWREAAMSIGIRSTAAFPMRYPDRTLGVLTVCVGRVNAFSNPDETSLLQEMADDLAYALVSLDARRQQVIQQTAAETMRDGLLILDLEGKIVYLNPSLAEIFGASDRDLTDENALAFLAGNPDIAAYQQHIQLLLNEGHYETEFEFTNYAGDHLFIAMRAALAYDPQTQSRHVVINIQDITRRRAHEHQLLTLNHLTTELVQIYDPQQLLHTILLASEELLQADASAIFLVEHESRRITDIFAHHLPAAYIEKVRGNPTLLPGMADLSNAQLVCIPSVSDDPTSRENLGFMLAFGLNSIMALPILFQEQSLGVLSLYFKKPHTFDNHEQQLGLTVAHTLAITLQNAHLYQAEHSQRQLAEALAQAAAVLNSSLDLDEVLNRILEGTRSVIPCQSVNLMLIEGEQATVIRHLDTVDPQQIRQPQRGYSLPLSSPTLQQMLLSGQPVLISDTAHSPVWSPSFDVAWVRSYASAPLQVRQEIIGFLNIYSGQPDFFHQVTLQRLRAFADAAATAFQNARLYRDLQQHTLELENRVLQRTAEVRASKDRVEAILASVPDAVFVLDNQKRLLEANQAGKILLAQAEQDRLNLFDSVFLSRLTGASTPDEKAILEICERSFQALASPLPLSANKAGLVIVFRDVTRFREIDRMKTKFISDVSHELRTPLTNLTIYLDLLSQVQDNAKRANYLGTLRRENERLTHLIEDLLTISRLEAGRLRIGVRPVNLNSLVSDLVVDRAQLAEARGMHLQFTPAANLRLALADPRLLIQVLSNLLTNALNYTLPGGSIRLSTCEQGNEHGDWITVTVSDTGVGIYPEEIDQIFERFYRGTASQMTGASGTGLGLAISKEIMAHMGGYITVDSTAGEGSTFTLWAPPVL